MSSDDWLVPSIIEGFVILSIPLTTAPSGAPVRGTSAAIEEVMTTLVIVEILAASFKIPTVPWTAGGKMSAGLVDLASGEAI